MPLLLRKVWGWLKRYWRYILFPVGIVLGIIAALSRPRDVTVTPPEVVEAEKDKREAQAEADEEAQAAKEETAHRVAEVEREHARTIKELNEGQKAWVEELRDDPDKLNEFLLGVGKDIRG